jgi:hypothetical protein
MTLEVDGSQLFVTDFAAGGISVRSAVKCLRTAFGINSTSSNNWILYFDASLEVT